MLKDGHFYLLLVPLQKDSNNNNRLLDSLLSKPMPSGRFWIAIHCLSQSMMPGTSQCSRHPLTNTAACWLELLLRLTQDPKVLLVSGQTMDSLNWRNSILEKKNVYRVLITKNCLTSTVGKIKFLKGHKRLWWLVLGTPFKKWNYKSIFAFTFRRSYQIYWGVRKIISHSETLLTGTLIGC